MTEDFRKSISAVLYERLTSPFYGAFIVSWLVSNWQIVYLTLFVDEKTLLGISKIDFIVSNYYDWNYLIWWPLGSSLVLVTLFPFVTLAIYWVTLWFRSQRLAVKNKAEEKSLITKEQWIDLRNKTEKQIVEYAESLSKKDSEIDALEAQVKKFANEAAKDLSKDNPHFDSMNPKVAKDPKSMDVQIGAIVNNLKEQNLIEDFKHLAEELAPNGRSVQGVDNSHREFHRLGLLDDFSLDQSSEKIRLVITDLGWEIYRYITTY